MLLKKGKSLNFLLGFRLSMSCENVNGVLGCFVKSVSCPFVFIFISGQGLEGKKETILKIAYEDVNNISIGEVYIIGEKTQAVEIYTDDFSNFSIIEMNLYSENIKTRETYIKRALLASSMEKYHCNLSEFKIHSSIQHKLWGMLSKSITTEMKVWELALMMFPVDDILSSAMTARYRCQRRELMLDILSCIKRGKIESILSLRREQEFWELDVDKQVEIVVSLSSMKKSGIFLILVSLWESFLTKKNRKHIDCLVPEKVSFEYVEGTCSMEVLTKEEENIMAKYCEGKLKVLPQIIKNKIKNVSVRKGTFEDWELEGKSVGVPCDLMEGNKLKESGVAQIKRKKKWIPSNKIMKKYESFYKKYIELEVKYKTRGECRKFTPLCMEVADILGVGDNAVIKGIKKYAESKNITL